MGGHYEKGIYQQLMEVMADLDAVKADLKGSKTEVKTLTGEVNSLRRENASLHAEISELKTDNASLTEQVTSLTKENGLLKNDNERMKRILSNDSDNSSNPPSQDPPGKAPNTYNSRKQSGKKRGAQSGHKGYWINKAEIEKRIADGVYQHKVREIGDKNRPYVSRYRLDFDIRVVATEVRIHADENGKYHVPDGLKSSVSYGERLRGMIAYLYSEGVVSMERISDFICALSGGNLTLSNGTVCGICESFSKSCAKLRPKIARNLLNASEICTDATPVTNNGKLSHVRNFSTEDFVLYCWSHKKSLNTLRELPILSEYAGILTHDHETALYHFGTEHSECNVHLERYLRKNSEETGNSWSRKMISFLEGMNLMRKKRKACGETELSAERYESYAARYDELIALGRKENKHTTNRYAKQEEKALLNRLTKYKENHLLFLRDFQVHYSNNISERDLRKAKNREKMAGGFRTDKGLQMWCDMMSFIGTVKRKGLNVMESIEKLMNEEPVIA